MTYRRLNRDTEFEFCLPPGRVERRGYRIDGIQRRLGYMLDHYVAICLFLGLFVLTILGVGDVVTVGTMGILLCIVGLAHPPSRADLWIVIPFIIYLLFCLGSSYKTFQKIVYGYASTEMIFPVLFLLAASLDSGGLRLLRRLCVGWTGAVAAFGIAEFACKALTTGVKRLGGLLGNPNALGIFLVLGWFALVSCTEEDDAPRLIHLEPIILAALALTLSMGSFLAMAAGILSILFLQKRRTSWRETVAFACRILSRAALGIGSGILMYLAADRTGASWLCLAVGLYVLLLALFWKRFRSFWEAIPLMAYVMTALGAVVAIAAVLMRPSSIATFVERLEMMRNGLGYLTRDPLFGVGPFQWRPLNMLDGDKYFNTYHIHNVLIHVGVESGLVAAAMLLMIAVRLWRKTPGHPWQRGQLAAFFLHCLMDTGFFYLGITALPLLTAGDPQEGGRKLPVLVYRLLFGGMALLFAWNLIFMKYLR